MHLMLPTELGNNQKFNELFLGTAVFFLVILPVFLTALATALLVKFVQKRKKIRSTVLSEGPAAPQPQASQLDDLTMCLIAVAVAFFILVMPIAIISILDYTKPTSCSYKQAEALVAAYTFLNSSVNFFIYYWKLPAFRKAVQKVLICCREAERENPREVYSVTHSTSVANGND